MSIATAQFTTLASIAPCCQERSNTDICAALDDVRCAHRLPATALGSLRLSLLFLDCNYAMLISAEEALMPYMGVVSEAIDRLSIKAHQAIIREGGTQ